MGSYTPRLNLYKPAGNENVNVDQLNSNWDAVDASLGIVNCTSATRPVSPPSGQLISESDTNKLSFWTGSSWKVIYDPKGIPALAAETVAAVSNLPSTGNWTGRIITVTADNRPRVWVGSWKTIESDSGWINFPFGSGWGTYVPGAWGTTAYRKINSRVTMRGVASSSSGPADIGTLPSGYRPPYDLQTAILLASGPVGITVKSTGLVTMGSYPGGTVTVSLGNLSFLVD